MKYLWMAVTPDKYELPLAVEPTAKKLGEKLGISGSTVVALVRKKSSGRNTGRKIVKIEL